MSSDTVNTQADAPSPTRRQPLSVALRYTSSSQHLLAIVAAGAYLLLGFVPGWGGWLFAAGAPATYAVTAAAYAVATTRTPKETVPPDQRHFIYLNGRRITQVLEGLGEALGETTRTRTWTKTVDGDLKIAFSSYLLPTARVGRRAEEQITQTLARTDRTKYRELEKFLPLLPLPADEHERAVDAIWKIRVEIVRVEAGPGPDETYLIVRIPELDTSAWMRIDNTIWEERPIGVPEGPVTVIGWAQRESPPAELAQLSAGLPALRLRPLAIYLGRR